jgi:hypothetical protein
MERALGEFADANGAQQIVGCDGAGDLPETARAG